MNESCLREEIARKIIRTFIVSNAVIIAIIVLCAVFDQWNLSHHRIGHEGRIVDGRVIMALIAGIVAQLGAISFTLSKWLFPSRSA